MQPNKHKFDNDVTRLISSEPKSVKPRANPLLGYIEEMPIPAKTHKGEVSEKMKDYLELLQLMEPGKDSILRERKDNYHIEKAARTLGYRMTYRIVDNRGIKLVRWWVVSRNRNEKILDEGVQE